jgi:hypothetical protein
VRAKLGHHWETAGDVALYFSMGNVGFHFQDTRATPNDSKLSDRGGWRGPCMAGATRRPESGAVTAGAVRCSAWLGVGGFIGSQAPDGKGAGKQTKVPFPGTVQGACNDDVTTMELSQLASACAQCSVMEKNPKPIG